MVILLFLPIVHVLLATPRLSLPGLGCDILRSTAFMDVPVKPPFINGVPIKNSIYEGFHPSVISTAPRLVNYHHFIMDAHPGYIV